MNLPAGVNEQELKQIVLQEKQSSFQAIKNKRELFLNRYALYNNISDSDNKIYVRLIRSTIQTLLGIYYTDDISVTFSGRQLWDDEMVETYQNLAKFDQEEMEMAILNYDVQWDRLFYGVGIRVFDYWDKLREAPVYRTIDPLSWYPDPKAHIRNHRFHGFDLELADHEITTDIYYNVDQIKNTVEQELDNADKRRKEVRELQDDIEKNGVVNPVYAVYNHFTTINGDKYLITLANDGDLVIRCEKIEAVYEEEKSNPNEIKFPVILNFYEPVKSDPFGICIPDLLEDKQKAEQLFLNLNRIKAENEAWGDLFLVDTSAIKNINDLKLPRKWPKYIKADMTRNPNPIREVDKSRIKSDAYNMAEIIRQQWSEDIGIDERTMWVSTQTWVTATENQRAQKNANVRLLLGNKINQWGEKQFWRDWLRQYYKNFDNNSEKNIKLNNAFGSTLFTVKRKDIATAYDIDIKIINRSEEEETKQKEKAAFVLISQMVLQDPEASRISKLFAKRNLARVNGMSREQRNVLFADPIEEQAKEYLLLLNNNKKVVFDWSEEIDPLSYLIVCTRAMDTDAKFEAIEHLKNVWFSQNRAKMQQPTQNLWAVGNIAASQMLQQPSEQDAVSLQDINAQ